MGTGLVWGSGEKKNGEEYIAEAVQYLQCSDFVHDTALKMHYYILKSDSFLGLAQDDRVSIDKEVIYLQP
jgi:hypothetical protein